LLRFAAGALAAAVISAFTMVSPSVNAAQCFTTPAGATVVDGSVSAQACFSVTTDNVLTVQLQNLLVNPTSVGQLLSDIFFTASGVTSGSGLQATSATSVLVASDGSYTTSTFTNSWLLESGGTTAQYHLTALGAGATGPAGLLIGAPNPVTNKYDNANASIAGSGPHNPFAGGTLTFNLALLGATAATLISDVVFSFGTTAGQNVAAVPIPAAVWLFISGLVGLIGVARRRQGGRMALSAA